MNDTTASTIESTLAIEGMTCASCVMRVEKALAKVPGVISAEVNLATETARVHMQRGGNTTAVLIAAVNKAGYEAHALAADEAPASTRRSRHDVGCSP